MVAALPLGVVACGGGNEEVVNPPPPSPYKALSVAPATAKIGVGKTQTFVATGTKQDDTTETATGIVWSSSSTATATIDQTGIATGVAKGTTTITATSGSLSATATLEVADTAVPDKIVVEPAVASVAKGGTQAFKATANYTDGTTKDVTAAATWTSSDPAIATVGGGTALALAPGKTTITATLDGKSGTAELTVTTAKVTTLDVAPPTATVAAGATQAFKATLNYDDKTTKDVTATATWKSSDDTIATVDATGLAKGIKKGTATITATSDGVSGTATLTVTDPLLDRIEVSPAATTASAGGAKVPFKATAIYADATTADVTTTATWASSDATIATVDATGSATPLKKGTTDITAAFGGKTGKAVLAVTDAVISKIVVTPVAPSIAKGVKQAFTAMATLSDGSTRNVTSSASWTSSTPATATIDTAGVATAVAPGTTTITATDSGVSGTATLTVTAATVTGLTIAPAGPVSLPLGGKQTFTATATYTDGTTANVSTTASFTSSVAGRVVFAANVASGATKGATNVTATLAGFTGTSNTVVVNVTDATLTGLAITPVAPADLPIGGTQAFKATATFSDGTTADYTESVVWTSSAPTVATVSNTVGLRGLATGVAGGTTNITAANGAIVSPAVALRVKASTVTLVSIAVAPASATVNKGATQAYAATGTFSDGSTADITNSPLTAWDVVDSGGTTVPSTVATVTSTGGTSAAGVATGNGSTVGYADPGPPVNPLGKVYVRARQGSVSGRAGLVVKETTVTSVAVRCTTAAGSATAAALQCLPTGISYPVYCTARATYADGTADDRTADASFTSTNAAVATFSKKLPTTATSFAGQAVFTVVGNGETFVVATVGGVSSWTTGLPKPADATQNAVITAGTRTLKDTTIFNNLANMNLGAKQSNRLNGTYGPATGCPTTGGPDGDNQIYEVTPLATWTSTFPAVAAVSNAEGSVGVVSALTKGNTSIGAAFGGINKTVDLTVVDKCVKALQMTPVNPTVPQDVMVKMIIKATYSDDSVVDLNPYTAPGYNLTFSNTWAYGRANGMWEGSQEYYAFSTGTLTATITGGTSCGSSVTSPVNTITVDPTLTPTALAVTPVAKTIPRGGYTEFVARATFGTKGTYNVSMYKTISFPGYSQSNPWITDWAGDPDLNMRNFTITPYRGVPLGTQCDIATYGALCPGPGHDELAFYMRQNSPYPAGVMSFTATYKTVSAAATLTVSGRAVASVTVNGSNVAPSPGDVVPAGVKPRIQVTVAYTDGSTENQDSIAGSITYESSDPSKISFASATSNIATALAAGNTNITATVGGVKSAPRPFVVNANVLCSIAVNVGTGGINPMPKNSTIPLIVEGFYGPVGCGSTPQVVDIADVVTPSSGNEAIVKAFSDTTGARAQSFGTDAPAPGVTLSFSKDGRIGTIAIVVAGDGCVSGVTITSPAGDVTLPRGVPIQVTVACTFIGSPVPCVPTSYTEGTPNFFATLPSASGNFGATGGGSVSPASGSSTIIATVPGACGGGTKASPARTVTVGTSTLNSVALTPASATIPRGGTQQYVVNATYAGGTGAGTFDVSTAMDITGGRTLFSASAGTLLSFQPGAKAVANTMTNGTATLNADYQAFTGGPIVSSTFVNLTISGVTRTGILVSTAINPIQKSGSCASGADVCYPEGGLALQLKATEQLSGVGTPADLTSSVTWSLVAPLITGASIDASGLFTTPNDVTGNQVQVVKATDGTFSKNFAIRIIDGAITGVSLYTFGPPATAKTSDTIPQGLKVQYDGTVTTVGGEFWATRNLNWTSSVPATATVGPSGAGAGLVTAVALGTTTVKAGRGSSTSGDLIITVALPAAVSQYCTPTTGSVTVGNTLQLRIWTKNSSGPDTDVTASTTTGNFSLNNGNLVAVAGSPGLYRGGSTGSTVVTTNYSSLPASSTGANVCTITINP